MGLELNSFSSHLTIFACRIMVSRTYVKRSMLFRPLIERTFLFELHNYKAVVLSRENTYRLIVHVESEHQIPRR